MLPYRQVAFSVRTNVMYDGTLDDESPVHGSAVSFKIGDFLHIFEKFGKYTIYDVTTTFYSRLFQTPIGGWGGR